MLMGHLSHAEVELKEREECRRYGGAGPPWGAGWMLAWKLEDLGMKGSIHVLFALPPVANCWPHGASR